MHTANRKIKLLETKYNSVKESSGVLIGHESICPNKGASNKVRVCSHCLAETSEV